jgi:hypothetical protein
MSLLVAVTCQRVVREQTPVTVKGYILGYMKRWVGRLGFRLVQAQAVQRL